MEASTITTIYEADDRTHQRVTERVIARERQTTGELDGELKRRIRSAERAAEQTLRASQVTRRQGIQSGLNLLGNIPGGGRAAQFAAIADDIKSVTAAANASEGALAKWGAAGLIAAAGVGAVVAGIAGAGLLVKKSVT